MEFNYGGWVEFDQMISNYRNIINDITIGSQFLLKEFNYITESAWFTIDKEFSSQTVRLLSEISFFLISYVF